MVATLTFDHVDDGGLGDRLLGAVSRGEKTTTQLAAEYLSGEPLPRVWQRLWLVDSIGRGRGVVATTGVTIVPPQRVDDDVSRDEGEGFADVEARRRAHVAFWHDVTELVRADARDPRWQLRKDEPVVVHWFRLVGEADAPESLGQVGLPACSTRPGRPVMPWRAADRRLCDGR